MIARRFEFRRERTIAISQILFLFFGSYTKKERVNGVLMPAAGVLRVRAPESAVVASIAVREGQAVKAGDLLMEIHRERFSDQAMGISEKVTPDAAQRAVFDQAFGIIDRLFGHAGGEEK